jgi:hypothetical protein
MGSRKKRKIEKPKPKPKPKKRLTAEQLKRSKAAKKGWETRRTKAKVTALQDKVKKRREAAIKGWETRRQRGWQSKIQILKYEPTAQAIIDRQAAEIKRLQHQLEIKQRADFILANAPIIKEKHQQQLFEFKGTKGYGLQKKVQSIYLDYQMIYENQRELYALYEEGVT